MRIGQYCSIISGVDEQTRSVAVIFLTYRATVVHSSVQSIRPAGIVRDMETMSSITAMS